MASPGDKKHQASLLRSQQELARQAGMLGDEEVPGASVIVGVVPFLTENEVYPWPREVVKAIREVDPFIVPIWVKYVCRTPAGTEFIIGRHAIGRMPPSWEADHKEIDGGSLVLGAYQPASRGAVNLHCAGRQILWLDILALPPNGEQFPSGIHGPYRPFDWSVFYDYRVEHRDIEDEIRERRERMLERKRKANAAIKAEHDYRWDHDWKHIKKNVQSLSDNDIEHMGVPVSQDPKPFVHLRSH